MTKVALTDLWVRSAKPAGHRVEIVDSVTVGLTLRIAKSGKKTWTYRYRDRITRRVERLTLGTYPAVSLAKARRLADSRRGQVVDGKNPRQEIRKEKAAERAAIGFDDLAERFLKGYVERRTPKSATTVRSHLAAARAAWGARKAKDIDRSDVIAFLRKRADAGAPIAANRTRSALSRMDGGAIDEGILDATPMVRIPKPAEETPRERALTDAELGVMWTAFGTLESHAMALLFRTLAVTGQRPGEVAEMARSELIDFDRPNDARWEIPSDRTKNGRRHVVPLCALARQLVKAALALRPEGDDSPWVFVSPRNPGMPFDRHSLARAFAERLIPRLGDSETERRLREDRPTPHDLRRTVVTGLARLGVVRETVKAVVNHVDGRDVTAAVYDMYDRLPEKRRALAAWESHVRRITGDTMPRNVVALR